MTSYYAAPPIPKAFIWRRAHSLTGLWFTLYLIEHLFTNSQAALLFGDDGSGFVQAVNWIKSLPYLPFIEFFLLGVPFLIHAIWGIKYLWTAKYNSFPTDGSKPDLSAYPRNHAYTWQRITAWILLVGIAAHVVHMRWMEYPTSVHWGTQKLYMVRLKEDPGLYTLSKRLGFDLYNSEKVSAAATSAQVEPPLISTSSMDSDSPQQLIAAQSRQEHLAWVKALQSFSLKEDQTIAVAHDFGTAELLMVRDVFKSPMMILLYTGLVLAACFHGFNGLWTFMIRWGVTLTAASQRLMRHAAVFLMVLIAFLGLAAVWGSYWLNLKM